MSIFFLAVLINQGTFVPTKLTYNKMKKIFCAISMMALLLCACSGDEKKEMPIDMPSISIVEQFLNDNNLYPNNKEEINSIDKLFIWDNHKVLLGQKNIMAGSANLIVTEKRYLLLSYLKKTIGNTLIITKIQ